MSGIIFFSLPIIAAILFINLVSIMKKIHQGKDSINNTGWGAVLVVLFVLGVMFLLTTHD